MKNTDQTTESPWFKTTVIPKLSKGIATYEQSEKILVLVQGKLPVMGQCFKYSEDDVEFRADGFNGNWNITHWMYIPTLPTN